MSPTVFKIVHQQSQPQQQSDALRRKSNSTLRLATKSSESRKNEIIASKSHEATHSNIPNQSHVPLRVTKPISPKLRSESRSRLTKEKMLTSEELELLKIEKEKREQKERLEKIKRLFEMNKVKTGESIAAASHIHSTKEPTIPFSPICNLTQRLGRKEYTKENNSLASNKPQHIEQSTNNGPKKPTVPQPFHFKSDARAMSANRTRKESVASDVHIPIKTNSENVQNFLKDARHIEVSNNVCKKLTIAQAPQFETEKRSKSRPRPHVKSLEEMEIEFMEKMKSMQFKAKPAPSFEKSVVAGTETENKEEAPKPVIEFKPFHFKIEERLEQRKNDHKADDINNNNYVFKALPMPDFSKANSNSTHIDIDNQNKPKVTIPVSPKLSGRERSSSAPPVRQKPHHTVLEKQRQDAKTFVPKQVHLHITEPKEFHFQSDERGNIYKAMLQEKLKREEDSLKLQRQYHAQPVPTTIFRKPLQVKTSHKDLTEFQEFNLKSVARHEQIEENKKLQLQQEQEQIYLQTEFHALPVPKTTYEPKEIKIQSEKELVIPMEIKFESDKRIEMRKSYDQKMKEKFAEMELQKKLQDEIKEQDENKIIQELRMKPINEGGMKFIAQPVLREDLFPSKQVPVIPLTEPKSPVFRTAQRSRTNSVVSQTFQSQLDMM